MGTLCFNYNKHKTLVMYFDDVADVCDNDPSIVGYTSSIRSLNEFKEIRFSNKISECGFSYPIILFWA